MTTKNETLYSKAMEAINALFEDQSVDVEEALINMNSLKDEIDILIEGLESSL